MSERNELFSFDNQIAKKPHVATGRLHLEGSCMPQPNLHMQDHLARSARQLEDEGLLPRLGLSETKPVKPGPDNEKVEDGIPTKRAPRGRGSNNEYWPD